MNRIKHKKSKLLLVLLVLIFVFAVGGTIAILLDNSSDINNEFTPSAVTTEITEAFTNNTKSNVKIKNTGNTDAYIRASVVVTWQNENGVVYGTMPVFEEKGAENDYEISINTSEQTEPSGRWILGKDGFYYWNKPVAAGESTGVLISECKAIEGKAPETGYHLSVEIMGSGIQSIPDGVVTSAWDTGVKSVDANQTLHIITK